MKRLVEITINYLDQTPIYLLLLIMFGLSAPSLFFLLMLLPLSLR